MTYYNLSIPGQSLLILGLFLGLCYGGCLLCLLIPRKNRGRSIGVLLAMVFSGGLLILYTAEARSRLRQLALPALADRLCSQTLILPLMVLLLSFLLYGILTMEELRFRKNTITRASIKEGMDHLTSGLCFYLEGGRIVLVNRTMNDLSFQILGRDLQNGARFLQDLRDEQVPTRALRLSGGDHPSFRLPDGRVWSFRWETIGGIHQLQATDTTQIRQITGELEEKNRELAALNLRLRKYGENVDELTRDRERLETKSRIHRELGQALLTSRQYLLRGEDSQPVPLDQWRYSIAMLRREAAREEEKPREMLLRIAASMGITLHITGQLPENEHLQKRFVQAAAEALTNAIRHAQAKHLYIDLTEQETTFTACFRNDGRPPAGPVTEGGGLGSLRKKITREGGAMNVDSAPDFLLTITLPKKGGQTP